MFGIIVVLGVILSAVLLALDTRHRTGRISYWRIIIAVAITFFGAGSLAGQEHLRSRTVEDVLEFLARYAGMLAFLWFIIVRPKKLIDKIFRKGSSLLKDGDTQQALTTFNQALDMAKSNNDRGSILYNIAICNLRLGQKEPAIKALSDVVSVLPSLKSRMAKDKDFTELHDDEQFRVLIAKG